MAVSTKKVKDEKEEVAEPLQLEPELPPLKVIFVGMSKEMPTGEGDMPAYEMEQVVSHWLKLGYKIAPNGVHISEGPNFWQFAYVLVKYPE